MTLTPDSLPSSKLMALSVLLDGKPDMGPWFLVADYRRGEEGRVLRHEALFALAERLGRRYGVAALALALVEAKTSYRGPAAADYAESVKHLEDELQSWAALINGMRALADPTKPAPKRKAAK